jgi:hypothetical protein
VPDSLEELLRRRELLLRHLEALDREIAASGGSVDAPPRLGAGGGDIAEEILGRYRSAGKHDASKARRGCLLLFAAAAVLLLAGLGALYFYEKSRLVR